MQSFFYGTYVTHLLFPFSFTEGHTLAAAGIAYVYSAESCACILARDNDMLKYMSAHFFTSTVQHICCSDQAYDSAKHFSETITLRFSITHIAFVFISCYSSSCHRYQGPFLEGYCSCQLRGTLYTRVHPGFRYGSFIALALLCFRNLYGTLYQ